MEDSEPLRKRESLKQFNIGQWQTPHFLQTAKEHYKQIYFEAINFATTSITSNLIIKTLSVHEHPGTPFEGYYQKKSLILIPHALSLSKLYHPKAISMYTPVKSEEYNNELTYLIDNFSQWKITGNYSQKAGNAISQMLYVKKSQGRMPQYPSG